MSPGGEWVPPLGIRNWEEVGKKERHVALAVAWAMTPPRLRLGDSQTARAGY